MKKTGVIYILTNPSFPQYVKIGYATDVKQRLDELNRSTAVPFAFRVYATYEVDSALSDSATQRATTITAIARFFDFIKLTKRVDKINLVSYNCLNLKG